MRDDPTSATKKVRKLWPAKLTGGKAAGQHSALAGGVRRARIRRAAKHESGDAYAVQFAARLVCLSGIRNQPLVAGNGPRVDRIHA